MEEICNTILCTTTLCEKFDVEVDNNCGKYKCVLRCDDAKVTDEATTKCSDCFLKPSVDKRRSNG